MTVAVSVLQNELTGKNLPGGRIQIETHEAFIIDGALRAQSDSADAAHPVWFAIAALRCMGITVEQLCQLAHQQEGDTLLFGNCRVDQRQALRPGHAYTALAQVAEVGSRTTGAGARLDSVQVIVRLREETTDGGVEVGTVTSTYLFKRAVAQ